MKYLIIISVAVLLRVSSAYAATIDMTAPLLDARGKPVVDASTRAKDDPDCDRCEPLTLGQACANALEAPDKEATPGQLRARGILADEIRANKQAALNADQISLIKRLLAKGYPMPRLIAQAYPLLDPNEKAEEAR